MSTVNTPVKKAYASIVAFLEANKDQKVKNILADVIDMCAAKSAGGVATASHRDAEGNVVAIRCNYYGLWFPTSHVDFGKKEGSATGMNSMCKEGANNFSKASRTHKLAKEQLLDAVAKGEMQPTEIPAKLEELETQRKQPIPFSVPGMGWETLEECLAQTPEQLDALVAAAQPAPVDPAPDAEPAH